MLLRVLLAVPLALMSSTAGPPREVPPPPELPPAAVPVLLDEFVPAAPEPPRPRTHWVLAKVTAYCPCELCCPGGDGHTATMADVREHPYGIAADPRLLPYGTMVRVPGYLDQSHPGEFWPVDDTGAAMRQDARRGILHIDLRYRSHAFAKAQGVRWVYVEVLDADDAQ